MNLWGRFGRWALLALVPTVFLMCEDPNEIGVELDPNDNNVNTFFREFILPTSVVFSDSVPTQEDENMAFGVYNDPVFGRIKATPYFQFGAFDSGIGPQRPVLDDAIYDSAILVLHYNFFYGEDFSQIQRMTVHEIRDTLFASAIYRSSLETRIRTNPIAETEFRAVPGLDSLQIIRVDDDYGQEALELVRNNFIGRADPVLLFDLPGIALVPDDDMDFILGVEHEIQASDSIRIEETSTFRIYYHAPEDESTPLFWDFTLFGDQRYMFIENDRSASQLSDIVEPFTEYVPADGNRYVHPITGINTKVDMTPIWDFVDSLDGFLVNRADFEINNVFDRGGEEDNITVLSQISLLFTGDNNKINGDRILTANGNINNVILDNGSYTNANTSNPLRIGYEDLRSTTYTAEISNYLQAAADELIERRDLMIYPIRSNFNSQNVPNQMDHLIFNTNDLRVRIFYTTLQ